MPRGKKSKLRAREKRRLARGEGQALGSAQATAAADESPASPSSPSLVSGAIPPSSPAAGTPGALASRGPASAVSLTSSGEGASCQTEEGPGVALSQPFTASSSTDSLVSKAGMLILALLQKYKMKETITKSEMLKIIDKKYKAHFPEILEKVTEHLELAFGLDLKEVDPNHHRYILVSKVYLPGEESLSGGMGFPKNGLLMPLLGMIFLNGNRATEEEVWEFLNAMGLYAGRIHFIFGEPRKFITKDLVQVKFLEYRQVPKSDPPRYEFLWGPRAFAETNKMKVLEFWAKVNNTTPSAFQARYEEALRDEEERAQARAAARAHCRAVTSSSSQH